MRDVLIESWDALHSAVFENVWDPAIMRYRNNRVYRGMSDGQWGAHALAQPRLARRICRWKRSCCAPFRNTATPSCGCNSFWELVAMGQQFGLPTRLLDWNLFAP